MTKLLEITADRGRTRAGLAERFRAVRAASCALAAPLSVEDQLVQSMPDASPTKWHLAHTTWFWETFVLAEHAPGYAVFDPAFSFLFNSYYEAVGPRHARPERGLISRPSLDVVQAYRDHVDAAVERLLEAGVAEAAAADALAAMMRLGFAHEEQHQELIVTDIKHAMSRNPIAPAAYPSTDASSREGPGEVAWIEFPGGDVRVGAEPEPMSGGFAFDNERPRHRAWLEPYALAARPVTNGEYAAFIADGGYAEPRLWLSDGWAEVQATGRAAPLYWRRDGDAWARYTLHGARPLDEAAPVGHLTYYEATAYAEWAGARLPDEREWEIAANAADPSAGDFVDPAAPREPRVLESSANDGSLRGLFGGVWEWTRSAYAAYPGYRAAPGAIGEYNGKFMCGQYVLKGGSCATPRGHMRASYRNFFPPSAAWQFSGLRLARDV